MHFCKMCDSNIRFAYNGIVWFVVVVLIYLWSRLTRYVPNVLFDANNCIIKSIMVHLFMKEQEMQNVI